MMCFPLATLVLGVWPWRCFGWHDTLILSCLFSNVYFNCIVLYSLYHNMDIDTMSHFALVSCTLSTSIGLVFGCALFWCYVHYVFPLLILWYSSISSWDVTVIAILSILKYTFILFMVGWSLSYKCRMFPPLDTPLNIGWNKLTSEPFMSCLYSLLGYSTRKLQALQLIVLAMFGAVDYPLASCMLVHFL